MSQIKWSIRKPIGRGGSWPFLHRMVFFIAVGLSGISLAGCGRVLSGEVARRPDANICGEVRAIPAVYEDEDEAAAEAGVNTLNSDFALLIRVKSALVSDAGLQTLPIDVGVLRGVITLYGKVDTPVQRVRATQVAWNVPGVRAVKTGIAVTRCS